MATTCLSGSAVVVPSHAGALNERSSACDCSLQCSTSADRRGSMSKGTDVQRGLKWEALSPPGFRQQTSQGHVPWPAVSLKWRKQRVGIGGSAKGFVAQLQGVLGGIEDTRGVATLPGRASAPSLASLGAGTLSLNDFSEGAGKVGGKSLEVWLQDAVVEIVQNLEDAPFLHYVFDSESGRGEIAQRKKVPEELFEHPESWADVREEVCGLSPDGVILVHRLEWEALGNCYGTEYSGFSHGDSHVGSPGGSFSGQRTDVWGLVVQGRHNKRHACYILRTTRIASLDSSCTRFSVTRAKCFGPSLHKQLGNSWLL
eukprot:TRINITY_DN711_c0_g1_i2.p1 TRINITY_DN711_c0_g1~~TRINITY_DN711_c0_g1_i2.p1  ORF type:complete len:314 (+),score=46.36 TRINITY_DN711_c0_g1_i2:206-1147(+)